MWLKVKVLGSADKDFRKKLTSFFKKGKVQVHLCQGTMVDCQETEEQACHIDKFFWYPPGDFTAPWLDSVARKAVLSGKELAADEAAAVEEEPPRRSGFTTLEDRLRRIKRRESHHVTFAGDDKEPPAGRRGDQKAATLLDGTSRLRAAPVSALATLADARKMKQETILVPSEDEGHQKVKEGKKRNRKRSLEDSLGPCRDRQEEEGSEERKEESEQITAEGKRARAEGGRDPVPVKTPRGAASSSAASSSDSLVPPSEKEGTEGPWLGIPDARKSGGRTAVTGWVCWRRDFMDNVGDNRRPKMFT